MWRANSYKANYKQHSADIHNYVMDTQHKAEDKFQKHINAKNKQTSKDDT
jgi:hypothetical protein